jgi:hypothetical protein
MQLARHLLAGQRDRLAERERSEQDNCCGEDEPDDVDSWRTLLRRTVSGVACSAAHSSSLQNPDLPALSSCQRVLRQRFTPEYNSRMGADFRTRIAALLVALALTDCARLRIPTGCA